jgi:plastocyanin
MMTDRGSRSNGNLAYGRPQRSRRGRIGTAALAVAGMLAFAPGASAVVGVDIVDFDFQPHALAVSQGFVVNWRNNGGTTHSVTSDFAGYWPSHDLLPAATFNKAFKAAGTFSYHCRFHPDLMKGKIRVGLQVEESGLDFIITAATQDLPPTSPFRLVIQRRLPNQTQWVTISNTRESVATQHITTAGQYSFRAAVKRASDGTRSGWSKVVSFEPG